MNVRRLVVPLTALLIAALSGSPAAASDAPTQTLHGTTYGGAGAVRLALDSESTATVVWAEQGGAYAATRRDGGFFGAAQTLVANHVNEIASDVAPNGKAVVVVAGGMEQGRLLAFIRDARTGRFGQAQVLVGPNGDAAAELDVAMSSRGRAVVTYQSLVPGGSGVVGAVSDANGRFGSPAVIDEPNAHNPRVDVDADGAATVVFDWDVQSGDEVRIASAGSSGPFGSARTLEELEQGAAYPDIAVNPDGDAVIVYEDFVSDGECPDSGTCSRDKIEVRYGNVGGSFGAFQNITEVTRPTATLDQEAAIDDSGRAAVIFSASVDEAGSPRYGIYAAVSDVAGEFVRGQFQAVSPHPVVSGPGASRRSFEIAAGDGEFTAFWSNDHNEDGNINEAWQASTSSGTFGAAHQLSDTPGQSAGNVHGARNNAGDTVAGWQIFLDNTRIQVSPVAAGVEPYYATNGDDDLTGTKRADRYYLRGGHDTFSARAGADRVFGGSGADTIAGGGGADLVKGNAGNDALKGNGGEDTLKGGGRHDDLSGGGGSDLLVGGGGRDLLVGNAGFDVLKGGPGRDICVVETKKERRRTSGCEILRLR